MKRTKRGALVSARTSATTGTSVVATPTLLAGVPLDEFEELLVYLNVTTPLVGTTPTMRIYLQRAVVPNPNPATDAHWDDFFCFLEITPASSQAVIAVFPVRPWGAVVRELATWDLGRDMAAQAPSEAKLGHWGDRIRIVEKMGGTITQAAIYNIFATGVLRTAPAAE